MCIRPWNFRGSLNKSSWSRFEDHLASPEGAGSCCRTSPPGGRLRGRAAGRTTAPTRSTESSCGDGKTHKIIPRTERGASVTRRARFRVSALLRGWWVVGDSRVTAPVKSAASACVASGARTATERGGGGAPYLCARGVTSRASRDVTRTSRGARRRHVIGVRGTLGAVSGRSGARGRSASLHRGRYRSEACARHGRCYTAAGFPIVRDAPWRFYVRFSI